MKSYPGERVQSKAERRDYIHKRIQKLEARIALLEGRYRRVSMLRLAVFFGGSASTVVLLFVQPWIGWACFALTASVFSFIAIRHQRMARSIKRMHTMIALERTQLARMGPDWQAIPEPLQHDGEAGHPFEADIDISASFGLHRLLDVAVSQGGSQKLRNWLLEREPQREAIEERQTLVRELIGARRLRERLRLNFAMTAKGRLDGSAFLRWLQQGQPIYVADRVYYAVVSLAAVTAVLATLNAFHVLPPWYWFSFGLYALLHFMNLEGASSVLEDATILRDELGKFRAISETLERYEYRDIPATGHLCRSFHNADIRPSMLIKRMERILMGVSVRANPLAALLFNAVFPWDFTFARKLGRARKDVQQLLPQWLEVLYKLEALCSLANFAWLNPAYTFPVLLPDDENAPAIKTLGLGHPLLPDDKRVYNDFTIQEHGSIAIVTGSNMSGKSTFLRTLGVNMCLAYTGAPVCAARLETSLFRLFTCIRVSDSVTDGISYFYAEVKRLRALLDELQRKSPLPVFFLIDEIFKGTNNVERLVGSWAYISALVDTNSIGLVATHDLELTALEQENRSIVNYHFRERITEGRMQFDYRLRNGPCPTTNALTIMKLEGLPVEKPGA